MNNTKLMLTGLCLMLMPLTGHAQSIDLSPSTTGKKDIFHKVKDFAEKSVVNGVDTNYIKTPERPWQVSITSRVAQTDLKMHSTVNGAELFDGEGMMPFIKGDGNMATDPRIITKPSTSLGVKVGYRGLSASYSFPIGGDKGQNLSFKSAGSWYAVNLRWHKFKKKNVETHYSGAVRGRGILDFDPQTETMVFEDWSEPYGWEDTEKEDLASSMSIQTLIFDGFYIFNHKKFSYGAAYNQKTIQVRSAGSPIVGLMGYYADFNYNDRRNADLIYLMDGIGRLRQYQLSLGAGYSYNFVPAKGWLINAMAMPMVTVVNRTRINTYESNFKELAKENMLYYVLLEGMKEELGIDIPADEILDFTDDLETRSTGVHSRNNRLALNFTTRLSVTYNWNRYFINANGQFNNFNYKHRAMHGHLNDWYINASVGVRL